MLGRKYRGTSWSAGAKYFPNRINRVVNLATAVAKALKKKNVEGSEILFLNNSSVI